MVKNIFKVLVLIPMLLELNGCGYSLNGFESFNSRSQSKIGDGNQTMRIDSISQPLNFPWVSYYTRSILYDEINYRRLAIWVNEAPSDETISVKILGYRTDASVSDSVDTTLITDSILTLEIYVNNGKNGALIWRSGPITYYDKISSTDEENDLKRFIKEDIKLALDKLQMEF